MSAETSGAPGSDPERRPRSAEERVRSLFRPPSTAKGEEMARWRYRLHDVIFEAATPAGKAFDVALLWAIVLSVVAVSLESVASIRAQYGPVLRAVEWGLTALFTVEYGLRLMCVRRPLGYATSFFGVVDLLSVIPTYLSLVVAGTQALLVIRVLRLLRVFRLYELHQFVGAAEGLLKALVRSRPKITVFVGSVLTLVVIIGAAMYLIEGPEHGFTSIPRSVYWAIVTLTTVGFGDITPDTPMGQALAAVVMLMGYGIIAVPTGIVSVEMAEVKRAERAATTRSCPACTRQGHDDDARHCKHCGGALPGAA
jgi:voltage-gated potassium channel